MKHPVFEGKIFLRVLDHEPGAMSEVFLFWDQAEDRPEVVKILSKDLYEEKEFQEKHIKTFSDETKFLKGADHPHIVKLFHHGIVSETDNSYFGHPYFSMEYLQGGSLRKRIKENKIDIKDAISIIRQIASALKYAHNRNVIHRDIKPENILFDSNNAAKLLDFGVLRTTGPKGIAKTKFLSGTMGYMAPEQHDHGIINERVDIYGLGCIFFEILTGKRYSFFILELNQEPVKLNKKFKKILDRMLTKDPENRFKSIKDLELALDLLFEDTTEIDESSEEEKSLDADDTRESVMKNPKRSRKKLALGLALLAITTVAMAATSFYFFSAPSEDALELEIRLLANNQQCNDARERYSYAISLYPSSKNLQGLPNRLQTACPDFSDLITGSGS